MNTNTRKRKLNTDHEAREKSDSSKTRGSQRPGTTRFLKTLRAMIAIYPHIITWNDDGTQFRIRNISAFEKRVLTDARLNIKTKRYDSWRRNLVNFCFKTECKSWYHKHGYFIRDNVELDALIRKRFNTKKRNKAFPNQQSAKCEERHAHTVDWGMLPKPPHQHLNGNYAEMSAPTFEHLSWLSLTTDKEQQPVKIANPFLQTMDQKLLRQEACRIGCQSNWSPIFQILASRPISKLFERKYRYDYLTDFKFSFGGSQRI